MNALSTTPEDQPTALRPAAPDAVHKALTMLPVILRHLYKLIEDFCLLLARCGLITPPDGPD